MKTAPQPRLGDPTFWCAVGLVLFALFFSFRSFVIREVAWAYPANYDQTRYLAIVVRRVRDHVAERILGCDECALSRGV